MDNSQRKAGAPMETPAQEKNLNHKDTSAPNQRAIILRALSEGPKTTVDLRDTYGIMAPAVRIKELREMGHVILTVRVLVETIGIRHINVAKYVYVRGPEAVPAPPQAELLAA